MIGLTKALFCLFKYIFTLGPVRMVSLIEESTTDPLTGLYNRRKFDLRAKEEVMRAERYSEIFAVIFFDLDGLKNVNDRYGHYAGDEQICRFAALMKKNLRGADCSFRIGGDEFIVLLPHTDARGAYKVAHRIRRDFSSEEIGTSFGISVFRRGGDINDMIREADQRMYKDKQQKKKRPIR